MNQKKKILIVEDELKFAEMVKTRLELEGFDVTVSMDIYSHSVDAASSTREVLRGDHDLIILDLMMPAGGGFELLKTIRNYVTKKNIPVIILTGKILDQEIIEKANKYKVSAIFNKPYEPIKFVKKIQEILDSQNSRIDYLQSQETQK